MRKRKSKARTSSNKLSVKERAESKNKEVVLDKAFVMGDGTVLSGEDLITGAKMRMMSKSVMDGSTQQDVKDQSKEITSQDAVHPPYEPAVLARFLDVEGTHFRCVKTKSVDAVGKKYSLGKTNDSVPDALFKAEKLEVEMFIEHCNREGFEEVMLKGSMDEESVGWGAFEVIRSMDKKIKRLNHVPASRVRVLKGWRGYIEINPNGKQPTYYLPFGEKVLSSSRKRLDGSREPYDGSLDGNIKNAVWNLRDRSNLNTKLPIGKMKKSANEILFIPHPHPKTVYYGVPDFIPAIGSILGNINIQDFFLQFFDHNAVPQYAVIVKGAKLSDEVKELIQHYFSQEIKGQHHKTLVIPIPASGGDVEVTFEKLSADTKEGSFQDTKSNNKEDIMVAHGVSPAIIGIADSAEIGSGKGTAQSDNYKSRIVEPSQERWQRYIKRLFRKGLGVTTVCLEFEELDAPDKESQRQNLNGYQEHGAMSINETRAKAKLGDPVEGGDGYFVMLGGVPIPVEAMGGDSPQLEKGRDLLDKALQKLEELEGNETDADSDD